MRSQASATKFKSNEDHQATTMADKPPILLRVMLGSPETKDPEYRARVMAEIAKYGSGGIYERSYGPDPNCIPHAEMDNYLDDRLSKKHRARVDAHLEECDHCPQFIEEFIEIDKNLREHNINPSSYTIPRKVYKAYDFFAEFGRAIMQKVRDTTKEKAE